MVVVANSEPIALSIVEGCARPISRQRTRRVRLRLVCAELAKGSIVARLASEILLSSLCWFTAVFLLISDGARRSQLLGLEAPLLPWLRLIVDRR